MQFYYIKPQFVFLFQYYDKLAKGELKNYRNRKVTGHEDFYFRLMYLRMVRCNVIVDKAYNVYAALAEIR